MGMASDHTECHMTLVQDWGRCGYDDLREWVGSGHPQPPPHPGGCSPFIECLGKTIVGSKCLFCYTGSRQEVGRKYKETRVSKGFYCIKPCIRPCIRPLNPNPKS